MNQHAVNQEIKAGLAWGGGVLLLALGAVLARKWGYIDSDTVTRLVLGVNGLMIAWHGNRIPKRVAPSAAARRAQLVAGSSMALSGLTYAGLWAFAPISVATTIGTAAIFAGIAATFSYCVMLRSKEKSRPI